MSPSAASTLWCGMNSWNGLQSQAGEVTVLISSHELGEIEEVTTHVAFLDRGTAAVSGSHE